MKCEVKCPFAGHTTGKQERLKPCCVCACTTPHESRLPWGLWEVARDVEHRSTVPIAAYVMRMEEEAFMKGKVVMEIR